VSLFGTGHKDIKNINNAKSRFYFSGKHAIVATVLEYVF
jgi:hypothetical protein